MDKSEFCKCANIRFGEGNYISLPNDQNLHAPLNKAFITTNLTLLAIAIKIRIQETEYLDESRLKRCNESALHHQRYAEMAQ